VTLVSLKSEGFRTDGAVKVEFSDNSALLLSTDYLPETILSGGEIDPVLLETSRELSPQEEDAFRFAALCYRAEKAALRLIARAEQNSLGLTAKLERRKFDTAVTKAVLSKLLDQNLLDNERYAERWVRSRLAMKKAPSPLELLAALGKRGVDRKSSLKALDKVLDSQTEYELLLKYLEKVKFHQVKRAFSIRAQLKHEGFSSAVLDRHFDN